MIMYTAALFSVFLLIHLFIVLPSNMTGSNTKLHCLSLCLIPLMLTEAHLIKGMYIDTHNIIRSGTGVEID